jgi:response regulator RpfG family c-di-GMP phosphodiesterase
MFTVRDDGTSVVVGLEVGADDYISKPFRPQELVSRMRAHLRRQRLASKAVPAKHKKLEFLGLEVDLFGRRVLAGSEEVVLRAKEFDVLAFLATSPGRVYSREQIMAHLWVGNFYGEVRPAAFTATMIPVIQDLAEAEGLSEEEVRPLWWYLALGADFGGNLTLIGASANVVVAGMSERAGQRISFVKFMLYGIPVTLLSLAVATVYVLVRYY